MIIAWQQIYQVNYFYLKSIFSINVRSHIKYTIVFKKSQIAKLVFVSIQILKELSFLVIALARILVF